METFLVAKVSISFFAIRNNFLMLAPINTVNMAFKKWPFIQLSLIDKTHTK